MAYTVGKSEMEEKRCGGYSTCSLSLDTPEFGGGDVGGVVRPTVTRPGEQCGMCLFGTAAGVPRTEVLSVRCGGGVEVLLGKAAGGACSMIVAMLNEPRGQAKASAGSLGSCVCNVTQILPF